MAKHEKTISAIQIDRGHLDFYILGTSPLVYEAMSSKGIEDILFPKPKKSRAELAITMKHNPLEEYRSSVYRRKADQVGPTRLQAKSLWFKAAISSAAKRMPGASMQEIKELLSVDGDYVDLYGIPQLYMSVVKRPPVIGKPDVASRAIVPQWACHIEVGHAIPNLPSDAVVKLLMAAGEVSGVGGQRPQRGGNNGRFVVVNADNVELQAIIKNGGLQAQDQALKSPTCYDQETETMWEWFQSEADRRDFSSEAAE